MIEIGSLTSASTNLTMGRAAPIDHSFSPYVGGGSGAEAGSSVMSFGDFIDMLNPLQHIPVVSSLYRGATGDSINPVSHIAGDALYGGVLGLASAGISVLVAMSDEAVASANDGQSMSMVVASLFGGGGSEKSPATQLASEPAAPVEPVQTVVAEAAAPLQTPALQSPILELPDLSASIPQIAEATIPAAQAAQLPAAPVLALSDTAVGGASQGMALDRSKPAYGGSIDSTMMERAQQNQTLALALAGGVRALHAQHDLRNSRFSVQAATAAPAGATNPSVAGSIENLQATKAINQYQNTAQSAPVSGASVNITN